MFSFLTDTIYQILVFLYHALGNNFGLSIIALTITIKTILLPIIIPSLKSAKKIQALKPKLDALKEKYKDKKELQQAQVDLYKEEGINPAAGCIPQIVQIVILIALYQVFMKLLNEGSIQGASINPNFLIWNLTQPDKIYLLPILAGLTQLIFSIMLQPGVEHHVENPKSKIEKQKEEDNMEMAQSMQQQMMYMMPLMTVVVSLNFQSGLVLYWVISTIYSIVQQFYFSGWGGILPMLDKVKNAITLITKKENGQR